MLQGGEWMIHKEGVLSAFGRFNERGWGVGGEAVLFAFGQFNEWGGGGGVGAVRVRFITSMQLMIKFFM